jgi:tetratricopeptide (TPR) repeat protein
LKNLDIFLSEIEVFAIISSQHGQFQCIQYVLQPVYNFCRELKGLNEQALAPLNVFLNNDELRDLLINEANQANYENIVVLEIIRAFMSRDMEKVQRVVNASKNIARTALLIYYVHMDFYTGLTYCYFARQTGDRTQMTEVQTILDSLEGWLIHSEWNWKNKSNLLKAECHYSNGEIAEAARSYDATISTSREHKFIHDEGLSCELAGYFYKEQGDEQKARLMFQQARDAYLNWGAKKKADTLSTYLV